MLEPMTSDMPGDDGRLLDNRYRLGSLLGVGGVASVYRAIDERLHRGVAIKLFRGDVADQLQRHEDEMRTLARLNHASLVTVFDAGTDETTGQPYLVMALVEGSTLADQLRGGALTPIRTAEIGASVADALAYVHGQGLVHRDVKPANVLISNAGRVFLADFGIARLVDSAHVTQAGDVLGTPSFFAPEQVSGEPVGPPADVYALGLVLLECLTGQREYDGTSMEVAMARLNRQPTIPPVLPAAWRDLLAGMTAREPASRLSAAQAQERLRRLAEGDDRTVAMTVPAMAATQVLPVVDPTIAAAAATGVTATTAATAADTSKKRPWIWVLVICLVIIAAAGTAVALTNRNHNNNTPTSPCSAGTTGLTGVLQVDMANLNSIACPQGVSAKTSAALHPLLDGMRRAATGTSRSAMNNAYNSLTGGLSTLVTQGQITEVDQASIGTAAGILRTDFLRLNPAPTPTTAPPTTPTSPPPTTAPPTTPPPTTTPPTTPPPTSSGPTTTPPTSPTTDGTASSKASTKASSKASGDATTAS
jgi:eukaryotic-like serine/threonine-protein kinase